MSNDRTAFLKMLEARPNFWRKSNQPEYRSESKNIEDILLMDFSDSGSREEDVLIARRKEKRHSQFKLALLSVLTLNSISKTANIIFSLTDMRAEKLLTILQLEDDSFNGFLLTLSALYFLQALIFSNHWSYQGSREAYKIFWLKEPAESWPNLQVFSNNKKKGILCSIGPIVVYSAFLEGVSAFYFINHSSEDYLFKGKMHVKGWEAVAGVFGSVAGLTSLSSEGMETYRTAYGYAADMRRLYAHPFSKFVCRIQDFTIAIMSSTIAAIDFFPPVVLTFGIENTTGKYIVLSSTFLTKFVTDYCSSNETCFETIDTFFESFRQERPQLKKIFVFGLALFTGAILADLQRFATKNLLDFPESELAALPFKLNEQCVELFTRSRQVRDTINYTAAMYPFFLGMLHLPGFIFNKILNTMPCKRRIAPEQRFFREPLLEKLNDFELKNQPQKIIKKRSCCAIL